MRSFMQLCRHDCRASRLCYPLLSLLSSIEAKCMLLPVLPAACAWWPAALAAPQLALWVTWQEAMCRSACC